MLRRYDLKALNSLGPWAIIVIDTDIGYFSAVSDHGNYAFRWSHPGGEFRAFLAQIDAPYAYSKLTRQRTVYDDVETLKAVKEVLDKRRSDLHERFSLEEQKKELAKGLSEIDEEVERLEDHDDLIEELNFYDWCQATSLVEPWEYQRTTSEPQCWAFCTKLLPRFQQMLRDELAQEQAAAASGVP